MGTLNSIFLSVVTGRRWAERRDNRTAATVNSRQGDDWSDTANGECMGGKRKWQRRLNQERGTGNQSSRNKAEPERSGSVAVFGKLQSHSFYAHAHTHTH